MLSHFINSAQIAALERKAERMRQEARRILRERERADTYAEALARGQQDDWHPVHPFRDALWPKEQTMTMTDEERQKAMTDRESVERLLEGVTPGPWFADEGGIIPDVAIVMTEADQRFIAEARELVPALLAESTLLREGLKRTEESWDAYSEESQEEYERAEADEARLERVARAAFREAGDQVDCNCPWRDSALAAVTKADLATQCRSKGTDCHACEARYIRALDPRDIVKETE